jgi:hypothetical protein
VLDGRVDEALGLGEGDDLVELAPDLLALHAEDGAGEEDVLAPGQVGVEARADFEETADAPADCHPPRRRLRDARQHFQQRTLARAVAADDADQLALPHFQIHLAERPDVRVSVRVAPPKGGQQRLAQRLAQRRVARVQRPDAVALPDVLDAEGRVHLKKT